MKNFYIKAERDLKNSELVSLEVYENSFPARHEMTINISVTDAHDLIEELQKAVRQIDEEMLAKERAEI